MPRFSARLSARPTAQSLAPLNLSTAHDPDVLQFVERLSGQDVRTCYQCGKCAAGCPLATAMDLAPQQIIRALQLGQPDLALDSDTLWLCVSCQTCMARCPCEVDLPRLMDALRVWAIANGRLPAQREIAQFHRVFLKSIELTGRVYEVGLTGGYNLTSGHMFTGFDLALPMVRKGKIKPLPQRVRARTEVAGIFRRAEELRAREARPAGTDAEGGAKP